MMDSICDDSRFEIIEAAKQKLIEATNIEMCPDEMAVLDSILFRMWQMGWLPGQEQSRAASEPTTKLVSFQDTEIIYLGGMDGSLMAGCVSISECSSCGRIVVEPPQETYYGQPADYPFDNESLWAIVNYCPHCGAKVVSE